MKYKIVDYPPFYFPLWKMKFPFADFEKGVILTWGKKIYFNKPSLLPYSLIKHEEVHIKQQRNSYLFGVIWLIRYVFSVKFRLNQEIEAHRAEYLTDKQDLYIIAKRLSSSLYGNIISYKEAIDLIKDGEIIEKVIKEKSKPKLKYEIYNIIKITSGGLHSWLNTSIGKIRKPNNRIFNKLFK